MLATPTCKGMSELPFAGQERQSLDQGTSPIQEPNLNLATDVVQYHILLGLAVTSGSAYGHFPPSREQCKSLFIQPYGKSDKQLVQLHVGGKAFTKHSHRASSGWWGKSSGPPESKNRNAEDALERIFNTATWRNLFWLPHDILTYEVRVEEGYGARFQKDLKEIQAEWNFRGFVEPVVEGKEGHQTSIGTSMAEGKVPPLKFSYKSSSDWPLGATESQKTLRIAILDSSFNPPSRAHYALATYEAAFFGAHLLLISSKNADKVHKEGDASLDDRIEMMNIMAKRMAQETCPNAAVACLEAATFAEKSRILLDHFQSCKPPLKPVLVFFVGFDTITRLFAKRYYDDSEDRLEEVLTNFFMTEGCEVICARRPAETLDEQDKVEQSEAEAELFSRPFIRKLAELGKLKVADVEGTVGISSTKIREIIGSRGHEDQLPSLAHKDILEFIRRRRLYFPRDGDKSATSQKGH